MRILVVSDVSGYMPGGVPAETRALLTGLLDRGHQVAFAGDIALGPPGIQHFKLTVPTGSTLGAETQVALRAMKPHVVHLIAMSSRGIAHLVPTLKPWPWILTSHSVPPYERKVSVFHGSERLHYAVRSAKFVLNAAAWKWLFRRRSVPHVVVHSQYVREIVMRYGCDASRTHLIPLGHTSSAPPSNVPIDTSARPHLLTVGGIAHTKGQHDVLLSLPKVIQRHPQARYTMIGEVRDRSYESYLQGLAARLGVTSHVMLRGGLSNDERDAALRSADVYVQPSHEEGFCLAFMEAASIVPRLVGADTGAIRAMCDGDPGMRVVPVKAPGELGEAIIALLDTHVAPDEVRSRIKRLEAEFSWSRYLDAHESLYRRTAIRVEQLAQ